MVILWQFPVYFFLAILQTVEVSLFVFVCVCLCHCTEGMWGLMSALCIMYTSVRAEGLAQSSNSIKFINELLKAGFLRYLLHTKHCNKSSHGAHNQRGKKQKFKNCNRCDKYYVPGNKLRILHSLSHVIVSTRQRVMYFNYCPL